MRLGLGVDMDSAEAPYRQLFENAPIGMVHVDLAGKPLLVNARAATALGYDSPEDFLANVPSVPDLWADPTERIRAAEIMLEEGVLRDFEFEFRRKDGNRITLSISANPWRDADGEVVGMQVSGIDVTQRIQAEHRLEEAQLNASIGFWSWRMDTNEFTWTKGIELILGADLTQTTFSERVHPDDRDYVRSGVAALTRTPGERFENGFRVVTPNGETKFVVARGIVEADAIRLSGSLQDISQQKKVEAQLTELNQMKTEFVGVVAHDLRTPLTVAAGYADLLEQAWDGIDPAERRELVGKIKRSLDRLGLLVAEVLDVSRVESGASIAAPEPFDLVDTVRVAVEEVASVDPYPVCDTTIEANLPKALGDRDAIWRVVSNLLSNATKYSPPDAPVSIEVTRHDDLLQVSVRDRGPGIDPSDQPKLFQRFSRVPFAGDGPHPPGTGLGLFICRTLVEAVGGTIWVDSQPGHGSTFSFTVPAATDTAP